MADKLTAIFGRNIYEIGSTSVDAKNDGPCPVCKSLNRDPNENKILIEKGDRVIRVMLSGRSRATWIHMDCKNDVEIPGDVQDAQAVDEVIAPAIKESPASLDGVISEIAKLEGRKAAYEAVMDIGPAELHVYQGEHTAVVKGAKHQEFEKAVKLAVNREPIFLIGPTGSGKSYMARQVAQATLRQDGTGEPLPYSEVPCSAGISEGHLMGKLLPTGERGSFEFNHAALSGAYSSGGFCTLEEIDGCDPNTLLCVNSAIAGEEMALPNNPWEGSVDKHGDFVMCIVGNTWGMGADRMYVGRAQLDFAFLDRFALNTIEVDYDKKLETVLCPDSELLDLLWLWRRRIADNKLRRIVSTRTIAKWYRYMHILKVADKDSLIESFFGGWSEDERKLVEHGSDKTEDED